VLHVLEPTLTIAPGADDAYFRLTAPIEGSVHANADEVLDFSGSFRDTTGPGLSMLIMDAATGDVLAEGEHPRVTVPQGTRLLLHVFGLTASDGPRGAGAYTLDIDVLPQLVSVESQPLLPDANGQGPSASIVLTFQGDRLDPTAAENPANYLVTTASGRTMPVAGALYDPGSNVDVATGITYPTAVRQTVTLTFDRLLPAGSYEITVKPAVVAEPYNQDESGLGVGHPVVSIPSGGGQAIDGSSVDAANLVSDSAGGAVDSWAAGTRFFTQLHDDLGALLDSSLTSQGDAPLVTAALQAQIRSRLAATVSRAGLPVLVIWLDPVGARLYPTGASAAGIDYDLGGNQLSGSLPGTFVSVASNVELLVTPLSAGDSLTLALSDVHDTARGGALIFSGSTSDQSISLTEAIRKGQLDFQFGQQQSAPLDPLVFVLADPLPPGTSMLPMRDAMEATEPPGTAVPVSPPPAMPPIQPNRVYPEALPQIPPPLPPLPPPPPGALFELLLKALRSLALLPLAQRDAKNPIDRFLAPAAAGESALDSPGAQASGTEVRDAQTSQMPPIVTDHDLPVFLNDASQPASAPPAHGFRWILATAFPMESIVRAARRHDRRRRKQATRRAAMS
jgi:hypothetical protein